MHPLLVSGAALAIYLIGWAPLAALLVYVLEASGNLGWQASAAIVIPACVVYAFVCLSPWYVVRMTPLRSGAMTRILTTNFGAAVCGSILLLAIARGTAWLLSRFDTFHAVDQRFRPHAPLLFGMGVLLYLLSAGMHYAMASVEESKEALNREMQALVAARDAELKALKAQINPHFLFNSLNSISALAGIDATRAREMCVRLSDFLRSSLRVGERGAQLSGGGAGAFRRPATRRAAGRAGMRSRPGAAAAAAAAGGKCGEARHRQHGGRRDHPPGCVARRKCAAHQRGEPFRSGGGGRAPQWAGIANRQAAVAGAVWRSGGHGGGERGQAVPG
ncbi:MAG: histidine kinase [Bryobacteraceae bacterium]